MNLKTRWSRPAFLASSTPFRPFPSATKAEYVTRQLGNPLHATKTNPTSSEQNSQGKDDVKFFWGAKVECQMPSVWNFQDGVIMVGGSLLQFGCLNIITWQKSAIRQIPCFSYNNPIFCPYWFTTLHQHMVFFLGMSNQLLWSFWYLPVVVPMLHSLKLVIFPRKFHSLEISVSGKFVATLIFFCFLY